MASVLTTVVGIEIETPGSINLFHGFSVNKVTSVSRLNVVRAVDVTRLTRLSIHGRSDFYER